TIFRPRQPLTPRRVRCCQRPEVPDRSRLHFAPMSLSPETVQQVAQLARLALQPEQATQYARQLSNIFDLVGQLEQADTARVAPMAHPLEMHQRLRPDAVTQADQRETFQSVAPAVENGLYLVPKVIE